MECSASATIDAVREDYGKDSESENFDSELKRLRENKGKLKKWCLNDAQEFEFKSPYAR